MRRCSPLVRDGWLMMPLPILLYWRINRDFYLFFLSLHFRSHFLKRDASKLLFLHVPEERSYIMPRPESDEKCPKCHFARCRCRVQQPVFLTAAPGFPMKILFGGISLLVVFGGTKALPPGLEP